MENKKYIDKVLDHLVRGTKMDYENEALILPFPLLPLSTDLNSYPYFRFSIIFASSKLVVPDEMTFCLPLWKVRPTQFSDFNLPLYLSCLT